MNHFLRVTLLVLVAPLLTGAGFFGPKDFDECILESMKGVTSDLAAKAIAQSCRSKFPAGNPRHDVVSRCFFIYAPVYEAAKKSNDLQLAIYGQKRIAWLYGYMDAEKNNPQFKAAFERNLQENKKAGIAFEEQLLKAIPANGATRHSEVMKPAFECDMNLDLLVSDLPK